MEEYESSAGPLSLMDGKIANVRDLLTDFVVTLRQQPGPIELIEHVGKFHEVV